MVLYAIQNLLLIKCILKTLPTSGINKYIKTRKRSFLNKTAVKDPRQNR